VTRGRGRAGSGGCRRGASGPRALVLTASLLLALCSPTLACTQQGASGGHAYRVVTVASGLSSPWGLAFLPSGEMLVTEKGGTLRLVRGGQVERTPISGVPSVWSRGQGGLMDVALHPEFARNRWVYLSFSKPGLRGATTAVVRGRFDGRTLTDVEEIFVADAWAFAGVHFGSRLLFDRDGFLHITVGERGSMRDAQNLSNHHGKHIRLHDDGRVPSTNPFVGRAGAKPEIYSYGHRNPQGLALHPVTGAIWSAEHGPRGGDELNVVRAGANYGWPVITYGINYDGTTISNETTRQGMEQPLFYFVPSIATSGLAIYHGDAFPNWRGDAFIGGLAGTQLARVTTGSPGAPRHEKLVQMGLRIRDVRIGPDGMIYLLAEGERGVILRVEPASGPGT
jgi:glucose/arabinose dehydrogenase